jgi:hypothetical protein
MIKWTLCSPSPMTYVTILQLVITGGHVKAKQCTFESMLQAWQS